MTFKSYRCNIYAMGKDGRQLGPLYIDRLRRLKPVKNAGEGGGIDAEKNREALEGRFGGD